ncbi:MAG: histidine-type phosphatase [Bacteroidales bacterium]|nr:histidine-type phosphatase [Bacteroidales bacterium]
MKKSLLLFLLTALALPLRAQTAQEEIASDPAKAAGLHYAYPGPQTVQMPAPRGYKPFYISHFGRHGSRWHIGNRDYIAPYETLKKAREASALTPLGEAVYRKVEVLEQDGEYRLGELTRLGVKQHQAVARRMYAAFPEVFGKGAKVVANSTLSPRVMMSMFSFCNELKSHNPALEIDLNSSRRDAPFVSHRAKAKGPLSYDPKAEMQAFSTATTHPERLMDALFADKAYLRDSVDARELYWQLYYVAEMAQNNELDSLALTDVFTAEELYSLWAVDNYKEYVAIGPDPRGREVVVESSKPILAHILAKADEAIASGGRGATLRFSHDSYLLPLAVTLGLDGCLGEAQGPETCADVFATYRICPMCANIQLVFFKNRVGDVLVKFLLNENEVGIPLESDLYPYYRWEAVRSYYQSQYQL